MRAAVFILSLLLAISASIAETPSQLKIVSDTWPPYVTDDEDMPGVDVETMRAVFDSMGVDVTFRILPWRRAQSSVINGEADGLLDVSVNEERQSQYWFPSEAINQSVTTLFCKACDITQPIRKELFAGKTLVVNRGYQYTGPFDEDPDIARIEVGSFRQGFLLIDSGRAEYFIVNRDVGFYTAKQMKLENIVPLRSNIAAPSPIYLAFHRSDALQTVSSEFSRALALFKNTQEYRQILAKYGIQR